MPIADLGQGIDQLSAENNIKEGFSEYLLNCDPLPEGYLAKRTGYQSFAGQIPFRISRIEHLAATGPNNLCFYLDNSIDLSSVRSSPIIVSGRAHTNVAGDFTLTDITRYYDSFVADVRKIATQGLAQTIVIANNEHEITSNNIWTGFTRSNSTTDNSNTIVFPDSTTVNTTNQEITITYDNNDPSFTRAFVYTLDSSVEAGRSYQATGTIGLAPTPVVINIPATTHNLSNFNIIPKLFLIDGSFIEEIIPDTFEVTSAGTVNCTFTYTGPGTPDYRLDLIAGPIANSKEGSIDSTGLPLTVPLSGLTTDFFFAGIYLIDTVTGNKELVQPDSIVIDAINKTANVTFINSTGSDKTFQIYWEPVRVITNKLCVTSQTTLTGSFPAFYENVQMTLWGLLHSEAYGDTPTGSRNGWTTHIDSYRSTGEQRLVSGLGGNLFAVYNNNESDRISYVSAVVGEEEMPNYYPNLRNRVESETIIGPAFTEEAVPARSRGWFKVAGATDGFLNATTTEYLGNNLVRYTIPTPGRTQFNPATAISSNDNDYLTVQQAGYNVNNGEFLITNVDILSSSQLLITVYNPNVNDSTYNESSSGMQVGVFTDRFICSSDSNFIPGDILISDSFSAGDSFEVIASDNDICYIKNAIDRFHLTGGLRITARRTSPIIPLRTLLDTATVNNIVRGDVLSYSKVERQLKVKSVNPLSDIPVTISVTSGVGTVTLTSGDTNNIRLGQKILLVRAAQFSGIVTVVSIPNLTSFTFETGETDTVSSVAGVMLGKTVEIDEDLEWQDTSGSTITVSIPQRWFPIEAPDDSFNLTKDTYYRHLDSTAYDNQAFLRSVMVADNLYLTNGADKVQKFDGENIYRAGLPRWQPHLFATTSVGTAGISISPRSILDVHIDDRVSNYFKVDLENEFTFPIGTVIRDTQDNSTYTVVNVTGGSSHAFIYVDRPVSGTGGTPGDLKERILYRYYFRLNAVDANNNIITSATVGSEDFRVELYETSTINLRLLGLPTFDNYDYNRLEVEIYRTKSNGVAPYYRIATLPMSFNNAGGYINYSDTTSDDTLRDLDATTSALMGAELGTRWSEPLKAKYATTAGNRLVLANLTANPQLDIRLVKGGDGSNITSTILDKQKYLFKKSNIDTEIVTNNINRINYEFISTALPTTINLAGISFTPVNVNIATGVITILSHGFSSLSKIRFQNVGGSLPGGLSPNVDYYVSVLTPDTIKIASTRLNAYSGNFITLSDAGTGTHYAAIDKLIAFTASSVTEVLTAPLGHQLTTGSPVKVANVGGTLPAGLSSTAEYYAIVLSSLTLKLAASYTDALAGIAVDIGTSGSGIHYFNKSSLTSFIVNSTNHGLVEKDWVYLFRGTTSTAISLNFAGWWQVAEVINANSFKINYVRDNLSVPTPLDCDRYITATNKKDVPVYLGTDYNYSMLGGNPLFSSIESTATRRLANAINATMRMTDTSLSGQSTFVPWMVASGGDDFAAGQLIVSQPVENQNNSTLEVKLPENLDGYLVFINDRNRFANEEVSAFTPSYPSRIIASYPNYPELFENPTAILDTESESAIDVNSADGQQITGLIPFFGDTAFGASLRGGVVVVFKTNSIYLVDLSQKATGANPVQKLESRGLGCTAPYSIAPSKEGIIFANESGIYKLTRQLTVEYVGRFIERMWTKEVDRDYLPIFHGHYYGIGNQYKLSVVAEGSDNPEEVLVYNTVREYNSQAGLGSWTKYDNHPAIGWANLNRDAFFASTAGEVFSLRRTGLKDDYRDDSSPINMEATLRAMHFGDPARRKIVANVTVDFRVDGQDDTGIKVLSTIDFNDQYDQLDKFVVTTGNDRTDGLSDEPGYRIKTIQFTIKRRRSAYIQTKITDNTMDQSVEIASVSYRVAGLEDTGILEAKDTGAK